MVSAEASTVVSVLVSVCSEVLEALAELSVSVPDLEEQEANELAVRAKIKIKTIREIRFFFIMSNPF